MGRTFLLTGLPGSGKTTCLKNLIDNLPGRAGGFYTEEVREGGRRLGFRLITLTGEKGILAHVDIKGRPRVGKYGVDLETLERIGVTALEKALIQDDYMVVDEIGKMELCSERFKRVVWQGIESEKVVLGTIMLTPHPWADRVKAHPMVTLFQVSHPNWEMVVAQVLGMLPLCQK